MWPLVTYFNCFKIISTVAFLILQTIFILGMFVYNTPYIANHSRWKSFAIFVDRLVPQNFSSEIACAIALAMQDYHSTANVSQQIKV